jgi:hypothetical protein
MKGLKFVHPVKNKMSSKRSAVKAARILSCLHYYKGCAKRLKKRFPFTGKDFNETKSGHTGKNKTIHFVHKLTI